MTAPAFHSGKLLALVAVFFIATNHVRLRAQNAAEGLRRGAQLIETQVTTPPDPKKSNWSARMTRSYKDLAEKNPASPSAEKAEARFGQPGK